MAPVKSPPDQSFIESPPRPCGDVPLYSLSRERILALCFRVLRTAYSNTLSFQAQLENKVRYKGLGKNLPTLRALPYSTRGRPRHSNNGWETASSSRDKDISLRRESESYLSYLFVHVIIVRHISVSLLLSASMLSHSILISISASSSSVHQVMMQKTVKPAQDMRLEQRWEICILLVDIKITGYTKLHIWQVYLSRDKNSF